MRPSISTRSCAQATTRRGARNCVRRSVSPPSSTRRQPRSTRPQNLKRRRLQWQARLLPVPLVPPQQIVPLDPVPKKQPGQTKKQLTYSLRQRNSQPDLRRQAEQRAEQDKAAFLNAKRCGHHERCRANARGQAFEDKGVGSTKRLTKAPGHQPDLARACSPPDKAQQVCAPEGGTPAIAQNNRVIDCRCAPGEMGEPSLRQQPSRQFCKSRKHILVLNQDECRNGRDNCADADQHSSHNFKGGAASGPQYEQDNAGDNE